MAPNVGIHSNGYLPQIKGVGIRILYGDQTFKTKFVKLFVRKPCLHTI